MPTASLKVPVKEATTNTKKKSKNSKATPKKTTPKKKATPKAKTAGEVGESTVGIRQRLRGWQASAWYHSNQVNLGTYKNRDDAVLALKVGREYLETTRYLQLSDEEIKSNKNSAKEAAMEAVVRNGGEINTKSQKKLVISQLDSRYMDDNVEFKVLPEHVDFYANIVSNSIDDRSYLEHVVNAMATINENNGCNRKQIMNYINDKFSEDKEEAPNKRINTSKGYINIRYELSNEMAGLVGKDNLTVKEVQSAVWDYTTKHCKQSGGAGGYTLDETMRSLLGTPTVSITTMLSVSLNVCVLFVCVNIILLIMTYCVS